MYISGELINSYCKWNLDNRYALRLWSHSTLEEGDSVFLKMCDVPQFLANPPHKKVRLVIHNSDETFEEGHYDVLEPYILSVEAVNCNSTRAIQLPLGFRDDQYTPHSVLDEVMNEGYVEKDILCLVNFLIATNNNERSDCLNYFKEQPFATLGGDYFTYDKNKSLTHSDEETVKRRRAYYRLLKRSKFVICPQGTGVDTHRLYEAIFFGAIPIVKTSFLDKLYMKSGKVVIVNDWSDVTFDFLLSKINLEFYSQQGEDILVFKKYINKVCEDGVFLEIGGYDGVTFSNTKFFEDTLHFKGLLIEPVKKQFDKLVKNRKKSICLNCAADNFEREVEIKGNEATAGIDMYMSESFKNVFHSSTSSANEKITAYPLSKILNQNNITYVDFFSLDVEGGEEAVLRGIDFQSVQFYIICVELDGHNTEKDDRCREILLKNGFTFDFRVCINEFWINKAYNRIDKLYTPLIGSLRPPVFRFLENGCRLEVLKNLNNITFITYGDDVFERSRTRLVKEANESGIFKKCIGYTADDIDPLFKNTCRSLFSQKRGGGYWCWKPHIVLKTMQSIPESEWILYADAGCTLVQERKTQIFEQIDEMEKENKLISAYQMHHLEKDWTKGDMFNYFGLFDNKNISDSGQYIATVFLVKNHIKTRQMFEKIIEIIVSKPHLIDDSQSTTRNCDSFNEHRHDQSLFSIMRKLNPDIVYVIPKDETYHGNAFVQATRLR